MLSPMYQRVENIVMDDPVDPAVFTETAGHLVRSMFIYLPDQYV